MVVCTHRSKSLLDARPSIGRLIELGEENYAMLAKLAPRVASFDGRLVSRIEHGLDLHLEVVEQTPYTTLVRLTYYFGHDGDHRPDPNIELRIYHDARQAEVLRIRERDGSAIALGETSSLTRKWRVGVFLAKWLTYCLQQGHRFRPQHAVSDVSDPLAAVF